MPVHQLSESSFATFLEMLHAHDQENTMTDQKPHEYSLDDIDQKLHHFENQLIVLALNNIDQASDALAAEPNRPLDTTRIYNLLCTLYELRQFQHTIRDARGFQWSPRVDSDSA